MPPANATGASQPSSSAHAVSNRETVGFATRPWTGMLWGLLTGAVAVPVGRLPPAVTSG
jgi:hypothetical protein